MSRSPHVSQPRRRLPTGAISAPGAASRSAATSAAAVSCASAIEAPAGEPAALLERLEDQRLLLRAHAFQRAEAALAGGALEIVERPDPELLVEQRDGLRADALQVQQVEDGRRETPAADPGDSGMSPVSTSSPIFAARSLPIPGSAEPFGRGERGDALGMVRDGLGGVAIRADLERVLVLDLEEIADLGEDACDGEVVHDRTVRPRRSDLEARRQSSVITPHQATDTP